MRLPGPLILYNRSCGPHKRRRRLKVKGSLRCGWEICEPKPRFDYRGPLGQRNAMFRRDKYSSYGQSVWIQLGANWGEQDEEATDLPPLAELGTGRLPASSAARYRVG